MFFVRDIHSTDLPQVYEFTVKLLKHHIGLGEVSHLKPVDLANLFHEGILQGFLLVQSENAAVHHISSGKVEDVGEQAVGYMIFHTDISLQRGCRGVFLDQFYIEPDYRLHHLGSMMMRALCERVLTSNGQYIKLLHQEGLGVEKFYSKLGFINQTKNDPGLHVFEVYGPSKFQTFMEQESLFGFRNSSYPDNQYDMPHILVLPFSQIPPEGNLGAMSWCPVSQLLNVPSENISPLGAKFVIVAENLPRTVHPPLHSVTNDARIKPLGPRFCLFLEQCSVCSWLGPMVNFSGFIGDTSILSPEILFSRVQAWYRASPSIRGAVWEVPSNLFSFTVDDKPSEMTPFQRTLNRLNIMDDTRREGWNIDVLDLPGMRKLISTNEDSFPT
ncbi:hypothetical protein EG68_01966 [Paragonimus skrjabini miyazakii]|uniref:N-acetyltransferase domain-containing protein n=1 Tax=Paragonimus skrjabini miyazakii TaxID=59628 RepID=A0A8S9Z5D6_9TREM|nr:hypothetical protein EG68_01966 [Paragonimus skrjabini miyazakii]